MPKETIASVVKRIEAVEDSDLLVGYRVISSVSAAEKTHRGASTGILKRRVPKYKKAKLGKVLKRS